VPSLWTLLRLALEPRWSDWRDFVNDAPYDAPTGITSVAAPGPFIPSVGFAAAFPRLAALLASARRMMVSTSTGEFFLYGWSDGEGRSLGWLSPAPSARPAGDLLEDHRLMLRQFGGIAATWHQPEDTWLLNLISALVARPDTEGMSGWFDHYANRCRSAGIEPEIRPDDYVAFAVEANGNLTLYHRLYGDVILFAPDHAFDHVVPLGDAPEYTLYRLEGAATFREWVETIAAQWSRHVRG
jgi:hypothetical protein